MREIKVIMVTDFFFKFSSFKNLLHDTLLTYITNPNGNQRRKGFESYL